MKNDKKALLENVKLKSWDYPKYRVWFQFSFIGSLIGTFIFSTVFFILDKIKHPVQFDPAIIFVPFVIALFGWIIGFLPAFLTGFIVAFAKIRIVNQKSYWEIFLIGFFSTAFLLYIWLMVQ